MVRPTRRSDDDRGTLLSFPAQQPEADDADFGEDILPRLRGQRRAGDEVLERRPGPPWARGNLRAAWLVLFALIVGIGTAAVFWPESEDGGEAATLASVDQVAPSDAASDAGEEPAVEQPTVEQPVVEEPVLEEPQGAAAQDQAEPSADAPSDEGASEPAADPVDEPASAEEPESGDAPATDSEAEPASEADEEEAAAEPEPEPPPAAASPSLEEWARTVPYTVRSGDRINLLALRFVTTSEALIELNALTDPTNLIVGELLLIPVGYPDASDIAPPLSLFGPETYDILWDTYEQVSVQVGDTLARIAARFETTAAAIAGLNGFEVSRPLTIGQELRVAVGYVPPTS